MCWCHSRRCWLISNISLTKEFKGPSIKFPIMRNCGPRSNLSNGSKGVNTRRSNGNFFGGKIKNKNVGGLTLWWRGFLRGKRRQVLLLTGRFSRCPFSFPSLFAHLCSHTGSICRALAVCRVSLWRYTAPKTWDENLRPGDRIPSRNKRFLGTTITLFYVRWPGLLLLLLFW
jgi:hypothetical protein